MASTSAANARETPPNRTLQLSGFPGQTLVGALALLALLSVIAETGLRHPAVRGQLPPPSVGSANSRFELKLAWLEESAAQGRLDCIFIGHSAAALGLHPEAFQAAFRDATGVSLRCFNFGFAFLRPASAARLIEVLARKYQTRLFIYGTNVQGYQVQGEDELASNAWLQYNTGLWTPNGWLLEHSYLYRHWLRKASPESLLQEFAALKLQRHGLSGFVPALGPRPGVNLTQPPSPRGEAGFFDSLRPFWLDPAQLAALDDMGELNRRGIQIVVVEMPVHPTFSAFFEGGEAERSEHWARVADRAVAQGLSLFPASEAPVIPPAGWSDRNHLDIDGARIFSRWLGQMVGEALSGQLSIPGR